MGALPLGERRRRIRPTARGDRAHSQGGALGSEGLPSRPLGGSWLPPPRIPAAGGAVRGAGAEAGAGSSSHACPRPVWGCHGGFHPKVRSLSPQIAPSPDGSAGRGVQPLIPQIQTSSTGRYRQLGACPRRSRRCPLLPVPVAGITGGVGPAAGCSSSPHKSKPPARPGGAAGRNRRRGRSGGRAEQLVPELRLPSFKLGEFK